MNQYQSVKDATEPSVKAFKIRSIAVQSVDERDKFLIRSQGDAHDPVTVSEWFISDQAPHVGGYFIIRDDGAFAFLPAEEFETDYMRIDA